MCFSLSVFLSLCVSLTHPYHRPHFHCHYVSVCVRCQNGLNLSVKKFYCSRLGNWYYGREPKKKRRRIRQGNECKRETEREWVPQHGPLEKRVTGLPDNFPIQQYAGLFFKIKLKKDKEKSLAWQTIRHSTVSWVVFWNKTKKLLYKTTYLFVERKSYVASQWHSSLSQELHGKSVWESERERKKIEEMVSYEWWNLSFEICLLRILLLIHFLHWNEEFREKKRKLRSDDDHKHYCYYYFPLVKWNLLAVWPNVNINSSPISLQSSPNSPPQSCPKTTLNSFY